MKFTCTGWLHGVHGCAVAVMCLCISIHIVVFCATGCLHVQTAELNCQLGLKQRIKFHMHRMVAWCSWVCCCCYVQSIISEVA